MLVLECELSVVLLNNDFYNVGTLLLEITKEAYQLGFGTTIMIWIFFFQ